MGQESDFTTMLTDSIEEVIGPNGGLLGRWIEGKHSVDRSGLIAGRVIDAVSLWLEQKPDGALQEHRDSLGLYGLEHLLCEVVGVFRDGVGFGPLEKELHLGVRRIASEHHARLFGIDSDRELAKAESAEGQALDELRQVLRVAKRKWGLEELNDVEALTGGLSGAKVVRVYYRRDAKAPAELGVLKTTDSVDDFEREKNGHSEAAGSWLGRWIQETVFHAVQEDERGSPLDYAFLFPLAFPPSRSEQRVPSLYDIVEKRNKKRSKAVSKELGDGYAQAFADADTKSPAIGKRHELLSEVVAHWKKPSRDNVWNDPVFWGRANLPTPRIERFLDGADVLPNPLCVLSGRLPCRRDNEKIRLPRALQHGDLNARNVMLPIEKPERQASGLRLIDFEKAGEQSALLDVCWLTFSILQACAPQFPSIEPWHDLPKRLLDSASGISLDESSDDGPFGLGLDVVQSMFRGLNRRVAKDEVLGNTFSNALLVTFGAAGMATAYYAARGLLGTPNPAVRPEANRTQTLMGLLGMRVAGRCFRELGWEAMGTPVEIDIHGRLEDVFA